MEVNRLLGDELSYEIEIRNLSGSKATVLEKREIVREAWRLEKLGLSEVPKTTDLDPKQEIGICRRKLENIEAEIQDFDLENKENELKRIKSRTIHIQQRLLRIATEESIILEEKSTLLCWTGKLFELLTKAYYQQPGNMSLVDIPEEGNIANISAPTYQTNRSILDEPNILLPEVRHQQPTIISEDNPSLNQQVHRNTFQQRQSSVGPYLRTNAAAQETDDYSSSYSRLHSHLELGSDNRLNIPGYQDSHGRHPTLHDQIRENLSQIQTLKQHVTDSERARVHEPSLPDPNHTRAYTFKHPETTRPTKAQENVHTYNSSRIHPTCTQPIPTPTVRFQNEVQNEPRENPQYQSALANSSLNLANRLQDLQFSPPKHQGHYSDDRFEERDRYVDVSRWNVRYDGVSSVNHFLQRIEELRVSRGVNKDRLLRSAPELFTKDALLWYRMGHFSSWDDLVEKLRFAFQPYDYEEALWEEIRRRTQGSQEKLINYISVMENMFARLSNKPTEEARVRIMSRNLLPYLQTQLAIHRVTNLQELIRLGRSAEETEFRIQRFCPPPTSTRLLVEPDFAYRRQANMVSIPRSRDTTLEVAPVTAGSTDRSSPMCWNCEKDGHRHLQCPEKRRIFCFKCGRLGVTTPACPSCRAKNGNAGRR